MSARRETYVRPPSRQIPTWMHIGFLLLCSVIIFGSGILIGRAS